MAQEKKTRQANIELLRIVAMLMIIVLHYLDKGEILVQFTGELTVTQLLHRQVQIFSIVAVNLYVLISGYFLVESKFTVKKMVVLWAQVLFYAWGIAVVFILCGGVNVSEMGIYDWIPILMPVTGNHYWFATIYLALFAVSPFLNAAIRNMGKAQHRMAIVVMVTIFSLWNTILPFTLPVSDGEGMDLPWFVCLYLIAAYIRKYPECIRIRKWMALLIYVSSAVLSVLLGLGLLWVDSFVGKLGGYAGNFFPYNSFFTLLGSIGLFLFFLQLRMKDGVISKCIVTLGASTFSVFLIHEHFFMRYLWPQWFRVPEMVDSPLLWLHMPGTVLMVFFACALIDLIRQWIFKFIFQNRIVNGFFGKFVRIEERINGGEK